MEMVLHRSGGDAGDAAVRLHRRRDRQAVVELAAAAALRLAPGFLLAGVWTAGAVPHPLRRLWTPRLHSLERPPPHGRALGAHDPRGAGTVPAKLARTLR